MAFNEQLPEWNATGVEPPASKKSEGWQPEDKPPADWFNWLFNRAYKALNEIRGILGGHVDASAPHTGHETSIGAQTKANTAEANAKGYTDTHAGSKTTHGIGAGYYVAKTSRSDQLPAYADIQGKPSSFTPSAHTHTKNEISDFPASMPPSAHKSTHASGGSDALTPADIGAAPASGVTDNMIGDRTISDVATPTGNTGPLSTLLGWLANMIKSITGQSSWRTPPTKNLEQINTTVTTHLAETATGAHKAKNIALEDIGGLFTATQVEGAMSELFTNVSDGKLAIATAITDQGGSASGGDTFAGLALAISGIGGAAVKCIQHGVTALAATDPMNVALSPIDLNKAAVFMSFKGSNITNGIALFPIVKLTSPTNLYLYRGSTLNSVTISWSVVEFEDVKSVQRGDYALSSSGSIIIDAVDISKSLVIVSHEITANNTNMGYCMISGRIVNSTTIEIDSSLTTADVHWQVIEFN